MLPTSRCGFSADVADTVLAAHIDREKRPGIPCDWVIFRQPFAPTSSMCSSSTERGIGADKDEARRIRA